MTPRTGLSALALLLVWAGCSGVQPPQPRQNTATVTVRYALPPAEVAEAIRRALPRLPVRVMRTADPSRIEAHSLLRGMHGGLRVALSEEEGGGTQAVFTSDYVAAGAFLHLPMRLVSEVDSVLGARLSWVVPEAVAPGHEEACEEPPNYILPFAREEAPPDSFVVVEQMPELIGGLEGFQRTVRYPAEARRAGIEGEVWLRFVVDEEGAVRCAMVMSGLTGGLNEASLSAVQAMEFLPGTQDGAPVRVRMVLPIRFRMR